MPGPDLNLLLTLDVLLTEGNVARAAERLHLSPSAMSRALARLRETTGDPLLVRAGRGLTPTPRALALRERIGPVVQEAQDLLRPDAKLKLKQLRRSFTLRSSEGFAETFGPALIERARREAPHVHIQFMVKPDKDRAPLRDGTVDLETGVVDESTGPEVHAQALFRDRLVGVVRKAHPLSKGKMNVERYAAGQHIQVSRRGRDWGMVDDALQAAGLKRDLTTTVGGFATALALARASDMIATVPGQHTAGLRTDLFSFALPFDLPEFTISLLWHPRMHADAAHRWLRGCVREVCLG